MDVEEPVAGSEALAGAVGALGSALVTGGGFGVWYLLRGRKDNGVDLDDQESPGPEPQDSHPVKRNSPPDYSSQYGNVQAKNVYSAGIGDNLTHKVSQNAPRVRATDF